MSEKNVKKCGECGRKLEGEGYTVSKGGKVIQRYCEECYDKPEVKERIRKMGADCITVKGGGKPTLARKHSATSANALE